MHIAESKQIRALTLSHLWHSRQFRKNLLLFCAFNCLLYVWIIMAHGLIPFHAFDYASKAYHFLPDSRAVNIGSFNLLQALGQYDAQWYLRIAANGYPRTIGNVLEHAYAFPPLYPALLAVFRQVFSDSLLGAFVLTQVLLIAEFCAIYWLVARWYSEDLATKTVWLVFAYPFSIFLRSYFSEGLFLLLLALLLDSQRNQTWFRGILFGVGLTMTRFFGAVGLMVLHAQILIAFYKKRVSFWKLIICIILSITPFVLLMLFYRLQTGDPLYFINIQLAWIKPHNTFPGSAMLWSIVHFFKLSWHSVHSSRIDVTLVLTFGLLVVLSRKWLPKNWWFMALLIWLAPILTSDTMSASRHQLMNLPIFIYAAHKLQGRWYTATLALSIVGLFVVAILFSSWQWVG